MMRRYILVLIATFLLCNSIFAKDSSGVKFYSSQFVGMSFGERGGAPMVHLINGIEYKRYSFGIGIAYDSYYLRKMPFYLDLRYTLLKSRVEPIVFTNIGSSVLLKSQNHFYGSLSKEEVKRFPGFYNEIGMMCKTKIKGNLHYIISVSYCISNTKYIRYGDDYWGGGKHYVTEDVLYAIKTNRINFKIGLQF